MERLRIILVHPQIPANVGNIARTAKAIGAELHMVRPLGFQLDERKLKRGSVGYWDDVKPIVHRDAEEFWSQLETTEATQIIHATKFGSEIYSDVNYSNDVVLIFGSEDEGVPKSFWSREPRSCRIPMGEVRCLNLATSVGVMAYEVVRQRGLVVVAKNPEMINSTTCSNFVAGGPHAN